MLLKMKLLKRLILVLIMSRELYLAQILFHKMIIDNVDKKISDVSGLATKSSVTILIKNLDDRIDKLKINDYAKKTSLTNYILASSFNTKSTELENKIKDADIIAKSAVTKANSIKSNFNDYAKKN